MPLSATPTRVALSIGLTVIDTQATLAAMWFFGWDPTKWQLYALGGVAGVLLTMMGFDVMHSIAEVKAAAVTAVAALAPAAAQPPTQPATQPPTQIGA
jgi:hypothetical protein